MAERGPIWVKMRVALAQVQPSMRPGTLDDLTTAATRVLATQMGNMTQNAQPMLEHAIRASKEAAWDEGYKARRQEDPNGPGETNPYREKS